VETRTIEDVKIVMETGKVDRIMLDNFSPGEISEALKIINHQYETEASGGIHFNTKPKQAAEFISITWNNMQQQVLILFRVVLLFTRQKAST